MSHGLSTAKGVTMMLLTFAYLVCIAPSIAGMYVAYNEGDDSCQKGDRSGLNLSAWLDISCTVDLVLITVIFVTMGLYLQEQGSLESLGNEYTGAFVIIYVLCLIVFRAWGIVLLTTPENNTCIGRGTDLGIVALCYIVISTLLHCVACTTIIVNL